MRGHRITTTGLFLHFTALAAWPFGGAFALACLGIGVALTLYGRATAPHHDTREAA